MSITQGCARCFKSLVLIVALVGVYPAAVVYADQAKPVASAAIVEKVNINTASAEDLAEHLQGVGPAKADAIVAYRAQFGAFESADELLEVKGIGPALLEQNRSRIVLR